MDIKFVLATLVFGTVYAEHENKIYLPLVKMVSDSNDETGSESNIATKDYIDEVFANMSNRFSCKYDQNGTDIATKEDILEMKREIVADISTAFDELKRTIENMSAFKKEDPKQKSLDCNDIQNNDYNASGVLIDCQSIQNIGCNTTGTYTIFPKLSTSPISVRCDMDTSNGGGVVIQRRVSDSVFYKSWSEYEAGFGNLSGNFWLGLRNIHLITQQAKYELRVDLTSMGGETAYAHYDEFSVGAADSFYKLTVGGYSGTAGDALAYSNGMKFSTYDQDHDKRTGNCAVQYHGAWWYSNCHYSNLNGDYGNNSSVGPIWYQWKGWNSPMKTTEMKIRRLR